MAPTTLQLGSSGEAPQRRHDDLAGALGALSDAPWPIRAIAVIGGVTCIACYLVWFLAADVKGSQDRQERALSLHFAVAEQMLKTAEGSARENKTTSERVEGYLRLLCVQGAKTRDQVQTCLSVR